VIRNLVTSLITMLALAQGASATEACPIARFSPDAGSSYLSAEAAVIHQNYMTEGLRLISDMKQTELSRCERLAVLRLEMAALTLAGDYETGLTRAEEFRELDFADGVRRQNTARPAVIFLQKLGRVTDAENMAEAAGLDWPVLAHVDIMDPGPRLPEPSKPLRVSYPDAAAGREGYCEVSYDVSMAGTPDTLRIACSDPVFLDAAEASVMGMQYSPEAIAALHPRRLRTTVPVIFRPHGAE